MSRGLLIFLAALAFVGAQVLGFCFIPGTDIALFLAFGWIPFLTRVVPRLEVRWDLVGSTFVYVVVLGVGAHLFLRWLYREVKSAGASTGDAPRPMWKWRWTVGGLTVVLLMFVAGTAAVGITHQVTWLARSPESLYRRGGAVRDRVKCASNLRQIGMALKMYTQDNGGSYPDALGTLVLADIDITEEVFYCPGLPDRPERAPATREAAERLLSPNYGSYLYFGKGLTDPVDAGRVIAVEPLENHDGDGANILYGDGKVVWMDRPEVDRVLLDVGFERVATSPRR